MKTKRRTYNTRRIRLTVSYSIQEAAELFGLHKNAVSRWIKNGLPVIDSHKPYLIQGSELVAYLKRKQTGRKRACKPDEFYCCKCRAPRQAWGGMVDLQCRNQSKVMLSGLCAECSTPVCRMGSARKVALYEKIFITQTIRQEHISEPGIPIVMCDLKENEKHEAIQPEE
jgi:hypothetical protein